MSLGLRPGEIVEIRSLEEILATLDEHGTLDGLPFMAEMAAFCGRRARVFRRIDKLNDWLHDTGLRRMKNMVLLEDLRCAGSSHGGCQANCHVRWKESWLRRVAPESRERSVGRTGPSRLTEADLVRLAERRTPEGGTLYVCQATEMTSGGSPLAWSDPRHFVRDYTSGNIRLRPLLVGIAIACFNWVQRKRLGATFPRYALGTTAHSPEESLELQPGELVRVKPKRDIEPTLNNRSKNRGLWFDREMLRFCGGEYRVQARLSRVISERTGALVHLTTPCIVLEGVQATGEYYGFNPENEHIFWREIWLERARPRDTP